MDTFFTANASSRPLSAKAARPNTINNRRDDLAQSLSDITGEGVDYVVETTGDAQLHSLAVDLLNRCGKLAILTGGSGSDLPGGRQVLSVIQGDAVPQRFIPKLIGLYRKGRFPFDRLIRFYPFRQINRAIAGSKRGNDIKPVLRICPEIP
jgi:aryl-alcohol dehydrogenase